MFVRMGTGFPSNPSSRSMSAILRAGTLVLAGAVASGCVVSVDSQGQIVRDEKRFSLDGAPELHLSTFDGTIEIQSWERPEVLVEIEKRGPTREAVDALTVESSQRGNRIELEVKRPRTESFQGFGFHVSTSAKLIVSVPRKADVTARTGDGSIRIDRVNGRLELRTGDGSIKATDVAGEMVLNTGDGSITVDGAEGHLTLDTGDGGVNVTGQLSAVKMHTGDGSIVYRIEPGSAMSDDWDISTGDGSVALYLPRSFNAELDAHTGDGTIRSDLSVRDRSDDREKRTLRARLGDGGKLLRIRSGDGSIALKER
jgi:DUF4097 and DUF4098 domain-containing protein YvlB